MIQKKKKKHSAACVLLLDCDLPSPLIYIKQAKLYVIL